MAQAVSDAQILHQVKQWVEQWIVALNICPFAKPSIESGALYYQLCRSDSAASQLQAMVEVIEHMQKEVHIETALLILPGLKFFETYLDTLALAEALLRMQKLEGEFQLASFHPDYIFEGEAPDSPSHYTNRSPWPIWHIIRESSLSEVLTLTNTPEKIPERNIRLMQKMGKTQIINMLTNIQYQALDGE